MPASALGPGDRVRDPGSGAEATIMTNQPTRSDKHTPGKLTFLLRGDDGRVVRMQVSETKLIEVV